MHWGLISIFLIACVQPLFVLAGTGGPLPTAVALIIAGLILTIFSLRNLSVVKQEFFDRHLIITGICCGIGTALLSNAVLYTNVAVVQVVSLLSPAFAAMLCALGFFDEKLTRWQVSAFLVGLIGIMSLSFVHSTTAPKNDVLVGFVLALCGTFLITISTLRIKFHSQKIAPAATQAVFLSWAGLSLLPLGLIIPAQLHTNQLTYISLIGLLFAIGNWARLMALRAITASKMLLLRPIGAVLATIISYFALRQTVTPLFFFGTIFILISVIILAKEPTASIKE